MDRAEWLVHQWIVHINHKACTCGTYLRRHRQEEGLDHRLQQYAHMHIHTSGAIDRRKGLTIGFSNMHTCTYIPLAP